MVGFIGHSVEIGITVGVLQRLPDPSENLGDVSAGRITKLPCNERAISVTRLRAADGSCSGIGHAMTDALVEKAWVVGVDRAQSENGLGKNGMPVIGFIPPRSRKASYPSMSPARRSAGVFAVECSRRYAKNRR